MPTSPLVSIVVTSYNHGAFIEPAIQSVLDQSIDEIEVLCVDDASNDDTAARLARFRDPRLRVITSSVNRGVHHRNLALRLARGTYVAFQNSDDLWRPGKLAAQVEFLAANPDFGACFTAVDLCDEQGKPCPADPVYGSLFTVEHHDRRQWLHRFYHSGNCLALPSALVRASIMRQTELMDPALFQCADMDLWVQIAAVAELHICPEPLTVIRVRSHGRNLSAPSSASHNRSNRETVEILLRYAKYPILGQIDRIFGDELDAACAADASAEVSSVVRLGLMATSSRCRHHRLAGIEFLRLGLRRSDLEGGLSEASRSRAAHRLFLVSGELDAQVQSNTPKRLDWVEMMIQLFWRTKSGGFSEEQSTKINCSVSSTSIHLSLNIPPQDNRVAALRLDVANKPVRLLLRELLLCNLQQEVLWRCECARHAGSQMVAMRCHNPALGSGVFIQTLDHDPQWVLPLSPAVCAGLSAGGTLDLVVQLA